MFISGRTLPNGRAIRLQLKCDPIGLGGRVRVFSASDRRFAVALKRNRPAVSTGCPGQGLEPVQERNGRQICGAGVRCDSQERKQ